MSDPMTQSTIDVTPNSSPPKNVARGQTNSACVGNKPEFPTCEKQKIEKTHAKEKQLHAQDSIYMV